MPPLLSRLNGSTESADRRRSRAELSAAIVLQRRLYQVITEDKRLITGRVYARLAAQTLDHPWDSVMEVHRGKLVGLLGLWPRACLHNKRAFTPVRLSLCSTW